MSTPTSFTVGGYTSPFRICRDKSLLLVWGVRAAVSTSSAAVHFLFSYLISELAILKEPELVLPVQIASINVAEIHLKGKK